MLILYIKKDKYMYTYTYNTHILIYNVCIGRMGNFIRRSLLQMWCFGTFYGRVSINRDNRRVPSSWNRNGGTPFGNSKATKIELWENQVTMLEWRIRVIRPYWRIQGHRVYIHKGPIKIMKVGWVKRLKIRKRWGNFMFMEQWDI